MPSEPSCASTRALAWGLPGLLAACVFGFGVSFWSAPGGCSRGPNQQAQTEVQIIRSATELYLAQNPEGHCPSMSDLVEEHMLNGNTNTEDPWQHPFAIDCVRGEPIAMSAGADGVLGSADDIL